MKVESSKCGTGRPDRQSVRRVRGRPLERKDKVTKNRGCMMENQTGKSRPNSYDGYADKRKVLRAVFLEPKPANAHIFSLYALPRLGGVLLATLLRERGWDVSVFVEEVREIDFDQVLRADLVGISTITSTAPRAYALADEIRQASVPVVLGGPHVTFLPEEALEHADMVIRGEGEKPVLALADYFEGRIDLKDVPGLTWRSGEEVVHNALPEDPVDLDDLPVPDLSLIHGFVRDSSLASRVVPVQTSRGCPWDCSFCSVTGMFGRKLRKRSPESIVRELTQYKGSGATVFFYDDNFTADRDHARDICRMIIASSLDLTWSAQVRQEVARDGDLLELMHRAGCRTVFIGFESVNPEALAESRKSQSVREMVSAVRNIRKAGIDVHGMFIFGFDADAPPNLEATLQFAMRTPITTAQFLLLTPFPGTDLLKQFEDEKRIILNDWSLYDGHHVVFEPKHLGPRQLQRKQVRSHWRFYSWPRSLSNLVKLKLMRTAIYLYARRVNARWKRQNRYFMKVLQLFSKSSPFAVNVDLKLKFPDVRQAVKKAQLRLHDKVGEEGMAQQV